MGIDYQRLGISINIALVLIFMIVVEPTNLTGILGWVSAFFAWSLAGLYQNSNRRLREHLVDAASKMRDAATTMAKINNKKSKREEIL